MMFKNLIAAFAMVFSMVPAAFACDAPEYRQFDFWLGEWEVHTPDGELAGTNEISKEYDGCVIHERYTTEREYRGESLNTYDERRDLWHQTWVDSAGTLLLLEGGLEDGAMVLEGETLNAEGKAVQHRITWTPNDDGSVRQFWQSKQGDGEWQVTFDGRYTKKTN